MFKITMFYKWNSRENNDAWKRGITTLCSVWFHGDEARAIAWDTDAPPCRAAAAAAAVLKENNLRLFLVSWVWAAE